MDRKKQNKFRVGVYRFWIEYNQHFEGESTRRMRKRAEERRLRAGNFPVAPFGCLLYTSRCV